MRDTDHHESPVPSAFADPRTCHVPTSCSSPPTSSAPTATASRIRASARRTSTALAREGTRFSANITPNLVCQPSRASILTGLLPLTHGVWDNGVDLDPRGRRARIRGDARARGLPDRVSRQGAFRDQVDVRADRHARVQQEPGALRARLVRSVHGIPARGADACSGTCIARARSSARRGALRALADRARRERGRRSSCGRRRRGPGTGAAQTWSSALPVAWHNSTWIADRAIALAEGAPQAGRAVLRVGVVSRSAPCVRLPRAVELDVRPEGHAAARSTARGISSAGRGGTRRCWKARRSSRIRRMLKFRAEGSRVPDQTDAQLAEMTANYYGMISLIDHNVGRILDRARRSRARAATRSSSTPPTTASCSAITGCISSTRSRTKTCCA